MPPAPAARVRSLTLLWVGALAIAGCFSDRGVAIEVDVGTTGATEVELYLGKTACTKGNDAGIDCSMIAPYPEGKFALPGEIWFRDALEPYRAKVNGDHKAVFQLRSDKRDTLPMIIAVGISPTPSGASGVHAVATATVRDLVIPADSARVLTVALSPAQPVVQPTDEQNAPRQPEDRVLVWEKHTPESSCVVVEHWDAEGKAQRAFVVPAEDPDCDDIPAPECNPAAYRGSNTAGGAVGKPECFPAGESPCHPGVFACTDLGGTTTTCEPLSDVCAPDAFCQSSCTPLDGECLKGVSEATPTPRIDCNVPTVQLNLCENQSASIDLDAFYQGGKCDQQPLIESFTSAGFGASADFGGAVMALGSPSEPCHFKIQWKSGTLLSTDTAYGLVQVSTAEQHRVLIPIALHFVLDACVSQFTCTVNAADTDPLWSCAP